MSSNWLAAAAAYAANILLALLLTGCSRAVLAGSGPMARAPEQAASRAPKPERASPLPVTARLSSKNYPCNLVVGPSRATAWFDAGFERYVPDQRWEVLSGNDAYLETLGDPGARIWSSPMRSPCAEHAEAPERVVAFAVSQRRMSRDDWLTGLMTLVNAIRARYPSAREIQLLPPVSGPNSTECDAPELPDDASLLEAIDRVSQQFDGLVQAGPRLRIADCDSFERGRTALTEAGNARAAQSFAEYYAADL